MLTPSGFIPATPTKLPSHFFIKMSIAFGVGQNQATIDYLRLRGIEYVPVQSKEELNRMNLYQRFATNRPKEILLCCEVTRGGRIIDGDEDNTGPFRTHAGQFLGTYSFKFPTNLLGEEVKYLLYSTSLPDEAVLEAASNHRSETKKVLLSSSKHPVLFTAPFSSVKTTNGKPNIPLITLIVSCLCIILLLFYSSSGT